MNYLDFEFIVDRIRSGAAGVLPTDTIYGIAASTELPDAVERIYQVKGRPSHKPFIILISSIEQLKGFSITINQSQAEALEKIWPGPVSVILPCPNEEFTYLHRGKQSLAFRMPNLAWLQELINTTGPIIATSANKAGQAMPTTLDGIMLQLPGLEFYIEGPTSNQPSNLAKLMDDGSLRMIVRSHND